MAEHKAPTQVTIAPYQEASQLQQWVDAYWKPALGLAVVIAALIVWRQLSAESEKAELDASWNSLTAQIQLENISQGAELPSAAALDKLSGDLEGTIAEPWAKALQVRRLVEDEAWEEAEAAIVELESDFPDHHLVATGLPIGPDGAIQTLPQQLRKHITSQRAFVQNHPQLYQLPALPEGSPRVKLETTVGDIVIGLYQDRAPEHVANFIKLASNGYYDGVKFHRVIPGFMIQSGDPNTKVGDPSTWGQGGPEYKITSEISDLYHFKGVLAAAKMDGEVDSSGSQFYITTGSPHHLDGKHTVYGVLLEGADTVRVIENSPVLPGSDRPEEPITINTATVL